MDRWYVIYLAHSESEFILCGDRPLLKDGEYILTSALIVRTEKGVARQHFKSAKRNYGYTRIPASSVVAYAECSAHLASEVLKYEDLVHDEPFLVQRKVKLAQPEGK